MLQEAHSGKLEQAPIKPSLLAVFLTEVIDSETACSRMSSHLFYIFLKMGPFRVKHIFPSLAFLFAKTPVQPK